MASTQSLLNYVLLLIYLIPYIRRIGWLGFKQTIREKWWMYICLAVCDVEANFLVVLAYQYTSLSSVMLLDCFSIPCVMILGIISSSPFFFFSFFFLVGRLLLQRRFRWTQIFGVLCCLGGLVALVLADYLFQSFGQSAPSNPVLGDMLCLAGALLYAVSNTGQEVSVTTASKLEYLALLGKKKKKID
jgi:solute carrier family 35 protein F1/2